MLSLQNADRSRNRILAIRYTVIILLCGALLMISAISTTKVRAQGQSPAKFHRVGRPVPNQYIVVLDDNRPTDDSRAKECPLRERTGPRTSPSSGQQGRSAGRLRSQLAAPGEVLSAARS